MKKNDLSYFWEFYKWQILAAGVAAVLGIYLLCAALLKKECALSVMLLDCHADVSQEQMEQELLQALQLNKKEFTVSVQNELMISDTDVGTYAMTSLSRFLSDVGSEKLDVCGMLESDFLKYDASGTFLDLRECLDEAQLQNLKGSLLVADDGRIVGIYADGLSGMKKDGCYDAADSRGVLGVVYNTKHKEMAGEYLMYLLDGTSNIPQWVMKCFTYAAATGYSRKRGLSGLLSAEIKEKDYEYICGRRKTGSFFKQAGESDCAESIDGYVLHPGRHGRGGDDSAVRDDASADKRGRGADCRKLSESIPR